MQRWHGAALIALGGIIWGSNGVIANYVNASALVIVFFRVSIAAGALGLIIGVQKRGAAFQRHGTGPQLIGLGCLLATTWVSLFGALQSLPIGVAVLLNYLAPVLVAFLAPAILHETISRKAILSLGFSTMGIILVSGVLEGALSANAGGVLLGLSAALTYALFIVFSKKTLTVLPSETLAFYTYLVAAILLMPFSILLGVPNDPPAYVFLLILGIFNTAVAVTLYFVGLKLVRAQDAAVLAYLEPVSALVFGSLFLSQQVAPIAAVGGALIVLAGLIVAIETTRSDNATIKNRKPECAHIKSKSEQVKDQCAART